MAHTALNLFHFAREKGLLNVLQRARQGLDGVLQAHPDVRRILVAEGYALP